MEVLNQIEIQTNAHTSNRKGLTHKKSCSIIRIFSSKQFKLDMDIDSQYI